MSYSTFIHSGIVNPKTTTVKEQEDPIDVITLDVPLLTRLLELSREDIKSDAALHDLLTRIIKMKNQGVLTMKDYDKIVKDSEDELNSIKKLAGI
jgi:hypothetical protein